MDIFRDVSAASLGPAVLSEKKLFMCEVPWSFEMKWGFIPAAGTSGSVRAWLPGRLPGKLQVTLSGSVFSPFPSQLLPLGSSFSSDFLPNCWAPQRCFWDFQPSFPSGNARGKVECKQQPLMWIAVRDCSGGASQRLWVPAEHRPPWKSHGPELLSSLHSVPLAYRITARFLSNSLTLE